MLTNRYLFALLFCVSSFWLSAQEISFKNYSLEEGLSNSNVTCFVQDNRGYLWIGTLGGGVNVFDGKTFKQYSEKDGLIGNEVRSMLQDSKGRIWLGTNAGINVFDGIKFHSITKESGIKGSSVLCLFEHPDGSILAGTDDGGLNVITEVGSATFVIKNYNQKSGLSNNFIFDITQGYDEKIWLATFYGGIDIVDMQKDTIQVEWLKGKIDIPSELIICIEPDGESGYWVGSYDQGIFHLIPNEPSGWIVDEHHALNSFVGDDIVWKILRDKQGAFWIATNSKGLKRMGASGNSSFTEMNGLPNNQLLSLLEDREGNLWIGTNGNGIARFSGEHFIHLTEKTGFFLDQIYSADQFNDGRLVFASYGSGIAIQKKVGEFEFDYLNTSNGLPGNYVSSATIDTNGHVWAATDHGVVRYDGKYIDTYTEATGLLSDIVNVIKADQYGVVWCGTKYGVSAIAGDRVLNITTEQGLIDNTVTDIMEDSKGNIWFGTLGGLAKYDRNVLQTFDEVEGLTYKRINTLCEGPEGNIWIATNGGGLFKLDVNAKDSVFIQPVVFEGLSTNSYTGIQFYNDTTLIAGFNRGFDKLRITEKGVITSVKFYGKSEGYLGLETNLNSVKKLSNGDIWFGTPLGATRFNPKLEPVKTAKPTVNITGLKLFYHDVDWSKYSKNLLPWNLLPTELELNHSEKQLTFEFAGISLSNPERVTYRLFLEGADEDWSPAQSERQITYPGLNPGHYVFKVVAIDENGNWSEPASFSFTIKPPWYQTYWFYAICLVVAIILVWFLVRYREMKLREEKEHLEKIVAQRTAEVVHQKEVIEEKNKDITDSINYASRIQEAMLPKVENLRGYFAESMILFMPKDIVSGDFYWFADRDDKIFFAASDCTGHGVPGAFMSMIGATFLNDSVNEKVLNTPTDILNEVRHGIINSLKQTGAEGEQKDGMDVALCAYNKNTGVLEFAGANNPMYLLRFGEEPLQYVNGQLVEPYLSEGGVAIYEIKPSKMPVGYYSGSLQPYTLHEFLSRPGDVVYTFSDGYPDQFGGPSGKKYKYSTFKQKLVSIQHLSLDEQKEELRKNIVEWMGEIDQIDDICIVAVKI